MISRIGLLGRSVAGVKEKVLIGINKVVMENVLSGGRGGNI